MFVCYFEGCMSHQSAGWNYLSHFLVKSVNYKYKIEIGAKDYSASKIIICLLVVQCKILIHVGMR